jgi:hypothetical protein
MNEKHDIAIVVLSSAALISLLSTSSYMLSQQTASGFTTTIQSLSYNNPDQKIAIDYPSDWLQNIVPVIFYIKITIR